jgi:lysyl-tRNA synthetase class 2
VHQLDEALLNAMAGMPSCSGVAMGLDRLLMAKLGIDEIEKVLLFPWSEA